MKITMLHLILLFALCVALPFFFNVNHKENIANYPSNTDIANIDPSTTIDLSGIKLIDISSVSVIEPFREGNTNVTNDNTYSTYDKFIDVDLIKEPGNSASEYLLMTPKQCDISNNCDEFLTKVDTELSIVTFFKGLYTRYNEPFTSYTVKDTAPEGKTYTLDNKEKLANVEGELKETTNDDTKYGELLTQVQTELGKVRDNYREYVRTHPGATTTVNGTTVGTAITCPTLDVSNNYTASILDSLTMPATGTPPVGVSSTPSGVSTTDASTSGSSTSTTSTSSTDKLKCVANNGTPIGASLCCGQPGTLDNTKYICPSEYPTCTGYKCGSKFGTCS